MFIINKFKLFLFALSWRLTITQNSSNVNYDIKSIYGQPFYHSVDLSWEVEDKYINNRINNDEDGQLNEPISFIINYCEIQGFDLQKCNTKVMVDNDDIEYEKGTTRVYKMSIKNLKMATKYSFNVRTKRTGDEEKSARKIIKEDDKTNESTSQTIIIPTKGFSAEATKCLPNESEIEIQTGPNFSGKIVSENSKCEIQGNPNDDSETYVMRIDHEKCGSRVSNDDLTVETYITVQENTGILTHSTRKFLVVCTFQPDTLTVRAKLALPSKNGEVIPDDEEQQMWSPDRERSSRNRQFKMVDKSALILKESNEHSIENAIGDIENLTEKILAKEKISQVHIANELNEKKNSESFKNPRFSRYATEHEKNNNSLTGITLGIGSVLIIIFIAFVALFYASKKRTGMEKLQTAATYN